MIKNKQLGLMLIGVSVVLLVLLFFVKTNIDEAYQEEIDEYIEAGEACPSDPELCPHEQRARAQIPIYMAGALMLGVIALGFYLLFFEKSQQEIVSTLEKQKQVQRAEEKFEILLKGLDEDEKKVIKAVKEQEGITQQTLRFRTDLHKSKLSLILKSLEEKDLITRKKKGKTKKVYLKVNL